MQGYRHKLRIVVNPVLHAYLSKGLFSSKVSAWKKKYKIAISLAQDGNFAINQTEIWDTATSELLCSSYL